jgi:hypothetical protein
LQFSTGNNASLKLRRTGVVTSLVEEPEETDDKSDFSLAFALHDGGMRRISSSESATFAFCFVFSVETFFLFWHFFLLFPVSE